jgi:TonB family protein
MLGAVIVIALGWVGMRVLRTDHAPTPAATEAARDGGIQTPAEPRLHATSPTPSDTAPVVSSEPPPSPVGGAAGVSPSEVHKEIPDVPRRARQTIHGHVRVSVRVIVNKDGTVFAALTDQRGPSRYFERLAIEAAKKWTFSLVDTEGQRILVLRFDFAREGTTARAVTVR